MHRKSILVFATVILLACNFLFPPKPTAIPTPEITTAPHLASTPQSSILPAATPTITPTGFTLVRLHPGNDDLGSMLAEEAGKAILLGQMPVVEFDATWCPPCQAIEQALNEKNELMMKAYDGVYLIKLDVDEWIWKNGDVQDFRFDGIPVYFKLDVDGNQTGEVLDGDAWGENIPENIAPVMDEFFHGT